MVKKIVKGKQIFARKAQAGCDRLNRYFKSKQGNMCWDGCQYDRCE